MLYPMVSASLEGVDKSHQIAIHVGTRILQGIANTCLSREVNHPFRLDTPKKIRS